MTGKKTGKAKGEQTFADVGGETIAAFVPFILVCVYWWFAKKETTTGWYLFRAAALVGTLALVGGILATAYKGTEMREWWREGRFAPFVPFIPVVLGCIYWWKFAKETTIFGLLVIAGTLAGGILATAYKSTEMREWWGGVTPDDVYKETSMWYPVIFAAIVVIWDQRHRENPKPTYSSLSDAKGRSNAATQWAKGLLFVTFVLALAGTLHHYHAAGCDAACTKNVLWGLQLGLLIFVFIGIIVCLWAFRHGRKALNNKQLSYAPYKAPIELFKSEELKERRSWWDTGRDQIWIWSDDAGKARAAMDRKRWLGWFIWIYWCLMVPLLAHCWAAKREPSGPVVSTLLTAVPWMVLAVAVWAGKYNYHTSVMNRLRRTTERVRAATMFGAMVGALALVIQLWPPEAPAADETISAVVQGTTLAIVFLMVYVNMARTTPNDPAPFFKALGSRHVLLFVGVLGSVVWSLRWKRYVTATALGVYLIYGLYSMITKSRDHEEYEIDGYEKLTKGPAT